MINTIFKLGAFVWAKLSGNSNSEAPVKYIFMKRVMFFLVLFLILWALINPESLADRLRRAYDVLPTEFIGAVATFLSGVLF